MKWLITGVHSLDNVLHGLEYHLARRLTAGACQAAPDERHEVLYLPAPVSPFHYVLRRREGHFIERSATQGWEPTFWQKDIWQFTPFTWLPALRRFPFNSEWMLQQSLSATRPNLKVVLKHTGFGSPDVLVVASLLYAYLPDLVEARRVVYLCKDDIRAFARAPRSLFAAEERLLQRCDVCCATSGHLADVLRTRGAGDVQVIRNAVEIERFDTPTGDEPSDLAELPHPRVLYVGAMNERFRADWVAHAARALPRCQFLLIGSVETDVGALRDRSNVHLLGPRSPESVVDYYRACDLAMIPFHLSPLVESTCPIKLYEYMAAGLPVVATRWGEIEAIGSPAELVDTAKEFAEAVGRNIGDPDREARLAFARENTWAGRIEKMVEAMLA